MLHYLRAMVIIAYSILLALKLIASHKSHIQPYNAGVLLTWDYTEKSDHKNTGYRTQCEFCITVPSGVSRITTHNPLAKGLTKVRKLRALSMHYSYSDGKFQNSGS